MAEVTPELESAVRAELESLVADGMITCSPDGLYSLTPAGRAYTEARWPDLADAQRAKEDV